MLRSRLVYVLETAVENSRDIIYMKQPAFGIRQSFMSTCRSFKISYLVLNVSNTYFIPGPFFGSVEWSCRLSSDFGHGFYNGRARHRSCLRRRAATENHHDDDDQNESLHFDRNNDDDDGDATACDGQCIRSRESEASIVNTTSFILWSGSPVWNDSGYCNLMSSRLTMFIIVHKLLINLSPINVSNL